jgi:glutamyl-Q tRNA(Asp) synthetase
LQSASSETGTIVTGSPPPHAGPYVGRFAPSPTGPLHFGSLIAAVASFLEARTRGGQWLLRIEDIDPPREQRGATRLILDALEAYGFAWDGPVIYQSASRRSHDEAVQSLLAKQLAYHCGCSRRDLEDEEHGSLGTIYPGTCRDGTDASETAIRVRTGAELLQFTDCLQGTQSQHLESASGDFIILRKDGLIAYQLAVVVDDHLQGITDIVRGIDLMDSTPRQIWLQHLLGFATPSYAHIPVATNRQQQKLSKSFGAGPIPLDKVSATLFAALALLRQAPPEEIEGADVREIWIWALKNWKIDRLESITELPVE